MPNKSNKFRVGLFVVISVFLGISALMIWGVSKYAGETDTYVTYFDQSVSGLTKDSIVRYRGVGVGHISAIFLAPDAKLVEVILELRSDFKVTTQQFVRMESAGITGFFFRNTLLKK